MLSIFNKISLSFLPNTCKKHKEKKELKKAIINKRSFSLKQKCYDFLINCDRNCSKGEELNTCDESNERSEGKFEDYSLGGREDSEESMNKNVQKDRNDLKLWLTSDNVTSFNSSCMFSSSTPHPIISSPIASRNFKESENIAKEENFPSSIALNSPSLSITTRSIDCLEMLSHEITKVLHLKEDPLRLDKCKQLLESYSGTDWIIYNTLPNVKGFNLSGYSRAKVYSEPDFFDLLILSWAPNAFSPIHNHPCKRCFLMPLQGEIYETRFFVDEEENKFTEYSSTRLERRIAYWIDDNLGWHSVKNNSPTLAVSLHLYIPSFERCKIFDTKCKSIRWVNCFAENVIRNQEHFLHEKILSLVKNYINNLETPHDSNFIMRCREKDNIHEIFPSKNALTFCANSVPLDDQSIYEIIWNAFDYLTNTANLSYLNQVFVKADPLAISADCLINCLNVNMLDFQLLPLFVLAEMYLLKHLAFFIRWSCYEEQHDNDFFDRSCVALADGSDLSCSPKEKTNKPENILEKSPITCGGSPSDGNQCYATKTKKQKQKSQQQFEDFSLHQNNTANCNNNSSKEGNVTDTLKLFQPSSTEEKLQTKNRFENQPKCSQFLLTSCNFFKTFDATINPDDGVSNIMAMNIARHYMFPDIKHDGMYNYALQPLVVYTSEEAHESIIKAASLLGIGRQNVKIIKTDDHNHSMQIQHLNDTIKKTKGEGGIPFFVNCTAGTTIFGAFDNFHLIRQICDEWNIWMHVDGSFGASFLLLEEECYKFLCKDMNKCDSITWNLNNLLGVNQQCSALITKHPYLLSAAHSYSNLSEILTDIPDFHSLTNASSSICSSLQCSTNACQSTFLAYRKADSFKAWIVWKKLGDMGIGNRVRLAFALTKEASLMMRYFPFKINSSKLFKPINDSVDCGGESGAVEPKSEIIGNEEMYDTMNANEEVLEKLLKYDVEEELVCSFCLNPKWRIELRYSDLHTSINDTTSCDSEESANGGGMRNSSNSPDRIHDEVLICNVADFNNNNLLFMASKGNECKRESKKYSRIKFLKKELIKANKNAFKLVCSPISCICCFWWIPIDLRMRVLSEGVMSVKEELNTIAISMKKTMLLKSLIMVDMHSIKNLPFFWRIPLFNSHLSKKDVFHVLNIINSIGEECFPAGSFKGCNK